MHCDNRSEKIHAYLKGSLTPVAAAEFERHCEGCGACRRELLQEKNLNSLLAAWAAPEPRPGFSTRLAARLSERQAPRPHWVAFRLPVFSALLAVLALSSVTLWHEWPRLSAQPRQMNRAELMLAGHSEFIENLDMLQHWEMLRHWEEIESVAPAKGNS